MLRVVELMREKNSLLGARCSKAIAHRFISENRQSGRKNVPIAGYCGELVSTAHYALIYIFDMNYICMDKRFIFTALAAVLALALTGCSDEKNEASPEYGVLTKAGDKVYEITFNEYVDNYDAAIKYFAEKYKLRMPACSGIYKDGMLMRNLDWYIKEGGVDICETVIRTTANEGRYATIGVINNPMVTDETYNQLPEAYLKLLPFALNDGMNSEGLMYGSFMCPDQDGISLTTGTNPNGEDLITHMIGREILDYCANVDEAIDLLKSKNCYAPAQDSCSTLEGHWMIADKERAVIVEFVDNKLVILEQEDLPYGQMFCTNHYLFNGGENTGHGMGYERDEIIKANYASVTDWKSGMALLEKLKYSNAYTIPFGENFWYSEFYSESEVGGKTYDFDCNTANNDSIFLESINEQIEAYGRREDDCWWTNHSSVYDISSKTLHLVIRENFDKVLEFTLQR